MTEDEPEFDLVPLLAANPEWGAVYYAGCVRAERAMAKGDVATFSIACQAVALSLVRVGEAHGGAIEDFLRAVAEAALRKWGVDFDLPRPLPPVRRGPVQ